MNPRISVYSLTPEAISAAVAEVGERGFRARQVLDGLYGRLADTWDGIPTLPAALRRTLSSKFADLAGTLSIEEVAEEKGTGTRKTLGRLSDGELVETVLIPGAGGRLTVCLSCQVGCPCKCAFCASGLGGLVRSLSSGEIVAQAVHAARLAGARPDNIVFMGSGEPFLNYDSVLAAARRLNAPAPEGLGVGARKITISTSGVVPGVRRLSEEGVQFELSVSLHAPNDALRSRLMPINRRWPVAELVAAVRRYTEKTGRIVTFEYTLVAGFNDGAEAARELLALLRPFPCRVNLIPLNPVPEFGGEAPSPRRCEEFRAALERGGVNATLRRSKGRAVGGSCGQLRRARVFSSSKSDLPASAR